MIRSFACADTEVFFYSGRSRRFTSIASVALRKLELLDNTNRLADLASPRGNRLELLKGSRAGQHSIRINDQYHICFRWNGEPEDVEVVDYR